jgi:hypothetical protein
MKTIQKVIVAMTPVNATAVGIRKSGSRNRSAPCGRYQ